MNPTRHKGGCWPTREQELLLRAALLRGPDAIEAWQKWKSLVDIGRLDPGSQRLLPLLARNLSAHGIKGSPANVAKGMYLLTWDRNRKAVRRMAALLRSLHDAGVQTMILKGAALALLHYKDYGLRSMGDFDVMVPTSQASAAIGLLTERGWSPNRRPIEAFTDAFLALRHAHGFQDAAGGQFDLHWHLLPECCHADADADFWDGAVATEIVDVPTHALNPTDQLLHACVHGARWHSTPPLWWAADAMVVMSSSGSQIDWDRLVAQSELRGLVLPMRDALTYLRDALDAPIPARVLRKMQDTPVSRAERFAYLARTRRTVLPGLVGQHWFDWLCRTRWVKGDPSKRRRIGLARYLQTVWNVESLWQVPFNGVLRALRRASQTTASHGNDLPGNEGSDSGEP